MELFQLLCMQIVQADLNEYCKYCVDRVGIKPTNFRLTNDGITNIFLDPFSPGETVAADRTE